MLLSQLEGGNVSILHFSIELLVCEMKVITKYNVQPDMFSLLANLIKCLSKVFALLCIDLHKKEHYHTFNQQCILNSLLSLRTLSKLQI